MAKHLSQGLKDYSLSYVCHAFLWLAKQDLSTKKCVSESETEAADLQIAEWNYQTV